MKNIIEQYFFGELSRKDKIELLRQIETDDELKKEFISVQNDMALAEMYPEPSDHFYAEASFTALEKKIRRKNILTFTLRYAGYAALIAVISIFAYLMQDLPREETIYTEYISLEGKRKEIVLSDGTKVILAPFSKLLVSNHFNEKDRRVQLEGEALLTVSKQIDKPFIVKTSKFDITVLGTVFNVIADTKSNTYNTNLLEGSILVSNDNQSLTLQPNEAASFLNHQLTKTEINTSSIDFMLSGVYNFENEPLRNILITLERWYNIDFVTNNNSLLNYPLSGKIREEDNVEEILKAIQQLCPFNYDKKNNIISIY